MIGFARDDGGIGVGSFFECAFRGIESEVGFAGVGIEAMASEAFVREEGADLVVEVDGFFSGSPSSDESELKKNFRDDPKHLSDSLHGGEERGI